MLHPIFGPFIFRVLCFLLSCSGTWSGSICKVHIALEEHHAFALMLHKMALGLSGKVISLKFDKTTAEAYLCSQGGTPSTFLSRLSCHILNQANMNGINFFPVYMTTHLSVEADYLSITGKVGSRVVLSFLYS